MREIIFRFLKRLARTGAEAHAAALAKDVRGLAALRMKGVVIALAGGNHHAAVFKIDAPDFAEIGLYAFADEILEGRLRFLEGKTQRGFLGVVEARNHRHAAESKAFVNGRHALLEVGKNPAVKFLVRGHRVHLHRHLGDDAEDAFAADAQVADVDAVGTLGHGAGNNRAARRDHAEADDHVLNLAVLIALHARRARGHPASEG